MEPGDGGDQAEAQSVAWRAAAAFEPVEAFQHVLEFVRWNPRPVVGDGQDRSVIALRGLDGNRGPLAAMRDRIVDQVRQRIEQQVAIAGHRHVAVADDTEMTALLFRRGIE
jgi:hypothetical protein